MGHGCLWQYREGVKKLFKWHGEFPSLCIMSASDTCESRNILDKSCVHKLFI